MKLKKGSCGVMMAGALLVAPTAKAGGEMSMGCLEMLPWIGASTLGYAGHFNVGVVSVGLLGVRYTEGSLFSFATLFNCQYYNYGLSVSPFSVAAGDNFGLQVGLITSADGSKSGWAGIQIGVFNGGASFQFGAFNGEGFCQIGLININEYQDETIQIGLFNGCNRSKGVIQIGLLNYNGSDSHPCLPIVNWSF